MYIRFWFFIFIFYFENLWVCYHVGFALPCFFFFFLDWVCNQLFMIDVGFFFSLVGLLYYLFFFLKVEQINFFLRVFLIFLKIKQIIFLIIIYNFFS